MDVNLGSKVGSYNIHTERLYSSKAEQMNMIIRRVINIINHIKEFKGGCVLLFLDAYKRVNWKYLLSIMMKYLNLNLNVLNWITLMYKNLKVQVPVMDIFQIAFLYLEGPNKDFCFCLLF